MKDLIFIIKFLNKIINCLIRYQNWHFIILFFYYFLRQLILLNYYFNYLNQPNYYLNSFHFHFLNHPTFIFNSFKEAEAILFKKKKKFNFQNLFLIYSSLIKNFVF